MARKGGADAIDEGLLLIARAPIATGKDSADRGEASWAFAPARHQLARVNRRTIRPWRGLRHPSGSGRLATKQVALVDVAASAT
jgi:hypothetical protein